MLSTQRERSMQQDCRMTEKKAEATETIATDPGALYDLVSDLSRMGEWSPEATGGRWVGGATGPAVGAKFHGNNAKGWRHWSTSSEGTTADRGKRFVFRVNFGPVPVSEWAYEFEPAGDGTRITERWIDLRPGWMDLVSRPVMGVSDRPGHNQQNIEATLAALKKAVENSAS
jgi:hypothetical protein